MRHPHVGRSSGRLLLVATAVSLTACTAPLEPEPQGQTVPAVVGAPVPVVDPALVNGITVRTISQDNPRRPVHASWPAFDGMSAFNQRLADDLNKRVDQFVRDTPEAPRATEAVPELNVSWELIGASGAVLGVRLLSSEFAGADTAETARVVWADTANNRVGGAPDLVDGQRGTAAVIWLITEAVRTAGKPLLEETPEPKPELVSDIAFDRDGTMAITVDECELLPCSEGRVTVRIRPQEADPLLSPLGHAVQQALRAATPSPTSPAPSSQAPSSAPGRPTPNCASAKCVALTFDDGPGQDTSTLLDELRDAGVRATFFVVGRNVSARPQLVARAQAEGHVIGNHSWDHKDLAKLSMDAVRAELDQTAEAVKKATGRSPDLFRPPYGSNSQGMRGSTVPPMVLWDVDTEDWKNHDAQITTKRALDAVKAGSIVLMHDIHPSTVRAVPGLIQALRQRGYELVTVPELFGDKKLVAGKVYTSG